VTVGVTPQADLTGYLREIPQTLETPRNMLVSCSHFLGVPAPLSHVG